MSKAKNVTDAELRAFADAADSLSCQALDLDKRLSNLRCDPLTTKHGDLSRLVVATARNLLDLSLRLATQQDIVDMRRESDAMHQQLKDGGGGE